MAWELPPSITRALDRLAISRVQRLEGEDSVIPTVALLSLDQPPFRKTGLRFFGAGGVASDVSGGTIAISTFSPRCSVVVDSIVISVSGAANIQVTTDPYAFTAGGVAVFVPENDLQRALPSNDLQITQRTGTFGGANMYIFDMAANTVFAMTTQILTLLPPPSGIMGIASLAVSVPQNGIMLRVSFSGRIWYSEE